MRTSARRLLAAAAAVLLTPAAGGMAQPDSAGVVLEDRDIAETADSRASVSACSESCSPWASRWRW